ncbi:MAG: flagellar biosynthesis protein FlgF, partial [Gemmataceae bacterium]
MSGQILYLLMTGASAVMDRMATTTTDLANANTTAYKAEAPVFRAVPYYGESDPDQVGVQAGTNSTKFA